MVAQTNASSASETNQVILVEMEGTVEVLRAGSRTWDAVDITHNILHPGDRLRTGERSRAVVRLTTLTPFRLGERSLLQVPEPEKRSILQMLRGVLYLFHRDKPGLFPIGTPTVSAVVRGTEFALEVGEDGTSTISVLDGTVEMANEFGQLQIASGETAVAAPGKAPSKTAAIEAINVIQWSLYYPGILDLDELELTEPTRKTLAESMTAYRAGDLLAALGKYPESRQPETDEEKIYLAALVLAVGQVEEAEKALHGLTGLNEVNGKLAGALRRLIATVKLQFSSSTLNPQPSTSSEWLAESYYLQARFKLPEALLAARKALEKSPNFGFGWARVGELEFSFGRTSAALEAVDKSLNLSPRNAEALALKGFLLAGRNEISHAISVFEQAIAIDGALGNAWLGRGLCRIRHGARAAGLRDLETAALLEPQRALLRSYLGKGFSHAWDNQRAAKELELAKRFDTNDPTGWLYSALVKQQENRINEAVNDLERSQDLNENRSLYRSRLLLDQDRAVRGVNLARVYEDAGLSEVSVWEASRALNEDYASFSAHLFLADSFQNMRDLRGFSQRFETPAVNEYLLANLLAPVGAGTLAHSVSQQEYSKLFESDGFGLASTTEYLSRGAWLEEAAQYGNFGNFGYALSVFHQSDPGQQPNNDILQTEWSTQLQGQFTPDDTAYFRAIYRNAQGGDLAQYFDPTAPFASGGPNTLERFKETQEPLLLWGYHHEWSPGIHTLALVGRLEDRFTVTNSQQRTLLLQRDTNDLINTVLPITIQQQYRNELVIYSAELQQIVQRHDNTVIVGARYQTGNFDTQNLHTNASFILPFLFPQDPQQVNTDFQRISFYGYDNWQVAEPFLLTAGLTYDRLTYPVNFRFAPVSEDEHTTDRLSPKAGFIWTPTHDTTLRFAYTRSLGGVSFDQSFRLEPVQVAGFNQAFRSVIPESVGGANSAPRFETFGLLLEQKMGHGTYLGAGGEILQSKVDRVLGTYDFQGLLSPITRSSAAEQLDFNERSFFISAYQLIGRDLSLGARYRFSRAQLMDLFPQVSPSATLQGGFHRQQDLEAVLHRVDLTTLYNHQSGFFGEAQATWYHQDSQGYSPNLPSEDFWQVNLFAGFRFAQRHAEVRLGLLNLIDQDYRLNPLNLLPDLPRKRTLLVGFRFYF